MTVQLTTLPNGLRIITDTVKDVESVALGVWADVGTRDEDMKYNGIAHMVEHMMFKGTARRTAAKIAEEIEDVGGQVNAFTSREVTAYHIHLLKDDLPLAVDILSDLIQHSTMPQDEVERERQVILQEIGMTLDTPDDLVYDLYQETAYPDQSLGAPILGRAAIIRSMERSTLMGYVSRFYTPSRLVIAAAGNVSHDKFVDLVKKYFNALPESTGNKHIVASYTGGSVRHEKELEQSHIILGFRGIGRKDNDSYSAMALSTMMGGGMSSRLFQEVREKRGLVYSVYSHHTVYQDEGQYTIYAGTGPERLPELMPVLCDEIKKSCELFTPQELKRAQAQLKAGILMAQESMMSRANAQAKHLIFFNEILDLNDRIKRIEEVSLESVRSTAERIFTSTPTLAALGPLKTLESYEKTRERLAA